MPGESNQTPNTVDQTVRKYTKEQDFRGGLKKNGNDVVGGQDAGKGLSYSNTGGMALNTVDSGSVTLSSGSATIDTGVGTGETATFFVAIGPDTDDADIACEVRADSGSGNYEVDIVETQDTGVGNPTVEYDIVRVQ